MNIQKKEDFMKCVCLELSQILDKPVQAVMVMISDEYMYMNNSSETVLFAEFRYVKDFDSAEEKTAFLKDFAESKPHPLPARKHIHRFKNVLAAKQKGAQSAPRLKFGHRGKRL